MDNAKEGITISDARLPDNPLIYVNKGYLKMTGYTFEEAIDRNCRYLQGVDSDPAVIKVIGAAIQDRVGIQVEIMNYRKGGEPFWNYLSITPIFNDQKELTHFIGIQDDITELKKNRIVEMNMDAEKLIAKAMLKAEKKERHRVGMELHDNISQMLGTIKLYLEMAQANVSYTTDPLKIGADLLNDTIKEVQALSRKLVSPGLDENDLLVILSKLMSTTRDAVDFILDFTSEGFIPALLSDTQQLIIFRVVQEQLNNIIKYSKASAVSVDLYTADNKCKLCISDNGVGFNTATVCPGIGLKNMRTRVEAVNGTMNVVSEPGKGTELKVAFDLPA